MVIFNYILMTVGSVAYVAFTTKQIRLRVNKAALHGRQLKAWHKRTKKRAASASKWQKKQAPWIDVVATRLGESAAQSKRAVGGAVTSKIANRGSVKVRSSHRARKHSRRKPGRVGGPGRYGSGGFSVPDGSGGNRKPTNEGTI